MILFDRTTAQDLHDALRLLEGRLLGTERRLSAGALEVRRACEVSLGVREGQVPAGPRETADDDVVLQLLTYDDVAARLQLSLSSVKRLVAAGELPTVELGTSRRVRPVDLEAYLAARTTAKETA